MNETAPPRPRRTAVVASNVMTALDETGLHPCECERLTGAEGFAVRLAGDGPLYVSDLVEVGARLGVRASLFLDLE